MTWAAFSRKRRTGILLSAGLVLCLWAFIWGNSLTPAEDSARQSDFVAGLLRAIFGETALGDFLFAHVRKIAHFVQFAALGGAAALFLNVAGLHGPHWFFHGVSYGLFIAVTDEAWQMTLDWDPAVADVLLDMAGYLCGYLALLALLWCIRRRRVHSR